MIDVNSSSVGSSALEGFELDELAIQKGLLQISEALDFLHNTASSVHLDIQPSSVLINSKGDWKLFGLGFVESLTDDTKDYFVPRYDGRLPLYIQINFDYTAPELVLDHKLDPANDVFSLGCLLITLFLSRPPMRTDNNPSIYKHEFQQINKLLRDSRIPAYLHDLLPQMLARYPTNRISLSELKNSPLFDNILIRTINFLDDFPAKLPAEQQAFMSGFSKLIDQFPKSVLQKKILPAFLEELGKEESLVGPILTNIFIIGKDMSQLGFSEKILPALRKVKDTLPAKVTILNNLEVLQSRLKGNEFRDDILPIVLDAMETAPPEIQEVALQKVPLYIEKLDFVTLKNDLFPKIGSVFAKTTSLAVKLESLHAFEELVSHGLDKYAVTDKLIPLLSSMKTREPSVMMGALGVYSKIVPVVEIEVLARQVIPQLLNMSMESMLNLAQFKAFMEQVHKIMDRVEKEHSKRLSQVQIHTNGSGSSSTHAASDSPSANDEPLNFENLVLGKKKDTSQKPNNFSSSTVTSPIASKSSIMDFDSTSSASTKSPTSSFGSLKLEPSKKPSFASSIGMQSPTTGTSNVLKPLAPPSSDSSSISWNKPASSSTPAFGFGSTGANPSFNTGSNMSSSSLTSTIKSPSTSSGIEWNKPLSTTSSTISSLSAIPNVSKVTSTISTASQGISGGIDWSKAVKPKPSMSAMTPTNNFSGNNDDGFGSFQSPQVSTNQMKPAINGNMGFSMGGITPLAPMKPQSPQQPPFGGISLLKPMNQSNNNSFSMNNGDDSLI